MKVKEYKDSFESLFFSPLSRSFPIKKIKSGAMFRSCVHGETRCFDLARDAECRLFVGTHRVFLCCPQCCLLMSTEQYKPLAMCSSLVDFDGNTVSTSRGEERARNRQLL